MSFPEGKNDGNRWKPLKAFFASDDMNFVGFVVLAVETYISVEWLLENELFAEDGESVLGGRNDAQLDFVAFTFDRQIHRGGFLVEFCTGQRSRK